MSSVDISEEVIRDRIFEIRERAGNAGRVDPETLREIAALADDLGKNARRLRWERAKREK